MKTKVTVLLDTERGYLSVSNLVRSEAQPQGNVIRVRCNSFERFVKAIDALRRENLPQWESGPIMTPDDWENLEVVVVDTVSHLADATRRALISETKDVGSLWRIKDQLVSSPRDWGVMSDMISRALEGLGSFCDDHGCRMILLLHESNREDQVTKEVKGSPDANAMLLSEIIENSDFVWRCFREESPVKVDGVQHPKNTHFIRLTTSEKKATKMRLPQAFASRLPDHIANPTLAKVFAAVYPFVPTVATIFGPPGSGKTTLSCSLSDPANYASEGK